MNAKTILVTGSNGQLGNELRVLAAEDNGGNTFLFADKEELDICDAEAVYNFTERHAVDVIINCAAYTAVDKAERDEDAAYAINAVAPGNLARAMAKRGGRLIHVSTDYVFNGEAFTPYTEECPVCPMSVYGRTKLEGEKAALSACDDTVIVRTSWLYSSFGHNFVKTMLRLGVERQELGVVFDQVGSPTYARDLAAAILAIVAKPGHPGIYHYANEGVTSWYDFTVAIHRLAGITTCKVRPIHTKEYPTPAKRPHYSVLDKSKIKNTFGIEIPHWADSLAQCMKLLEKQQA